MHYTIYVCVYVCVFVCMYVLIIGHCGSEKRWHSTRIIDVLSFLFISFFWCLLFPFSRTFCQLLCWLFFDSDSSMMRENSRTATTTTRKRAVERNNKNEKRICVHEYMLFFVVPHLLVMSTVNVRCRRYIYIYKLKKIEKMTECKGISNETLKERFIQTIFRFVVFFFSLFICLTFVAFPCRLITSLFFSSCH